ncbi:Gti1/Pac2 family-domain-containing protein [Lipomyces japonicus]|uniref:Gti1/Pac2 family-domain-containing protein n=1 Tax=Lipomyces japonicus TaxID=56871 RepID=UPI0034CE318C
METYFGHVRTPLDAIILFEACRLGVLPRVQRRLSEKERLAIRSGSVFVWDEREAGMRRWTDGKSWSASRVSGSFLTYREMEGKRAGTYGGPLVDSPPPSAPAHSSRKQSPSDANHGFDSDSDRIDDGPDGYRYKADGLMKQSFSIQTSSHLKLHLISYFSRHHAQQDDLVQPSRDPALKFIRIPKGMYPDATTSDPESVHAGTQFNHPSLHEQQPPPPPPPPHSQPQPQHQPQYGHSLNAPINYQSHPPQHSQSQPHPSVHHQPQPQPHLLQQAHPAPHHALPPSHLQSQPQQQPHHAPLSQSIASMIHREPQQLNAFPPQHEHPTQHQYQPQHQTYWPPSPISTPPTYSAHGIASAASSQQHGMHVQQMLSGPPPQPPPQQQQQQQPFHHHVSPVQVHSQQSFLHPHIQQTQQPGQQLSPQQQHQQQIHHNNQVHQPPSPLPPQPQQIPRQVSQSYSPVQQATMPNVPGIRTEVLPSVSNMVAGLQVQDIPIDKVNFGEDLRAIKALNRGFSL